MGRENVDIFVVDKFIDFLLEMYTTMWDKHIRYRNS